MTTTRQESARMVWFGVGKKALPKRPAAGLLLISRDTGRVLLSLRAHWMADGDSWSTPGGVADEGEALVVTAFREFGEELAVELTAADCEFKTEYTVWNLRRSYTTFVAVVDEEFDTEPDMHETMDADWFDIEWALENLNLHPQLVQVLADFR